MTYTDEFVFLADLRHSLKTTLDQLNEVGFSTASSCISSLLDTVNFYLAKNVGGDSDE